ncbi:HNH endonuclease [Mesorhizobium sp. B3-1-3]|uniref:HNH endonuclease n=1 Tax=unclassified Mesorhizobium TaxID=325217 RepID=UPI001126993B|nr:MULTISPECIES: HNH endonuclease [unclassified Mesorhizobium]TPI70025.1 HNH endonuclease [Mesorhizobium sp. B3-1-8]TPI75160.1 HNH endonuclease [Mesorhizobium sp. B3-1-3]
MSAPAKCIVTGDPITPANNSKAHVVPSALGGRLKPKGILSRIGNGILDDKFDYPLIEAFQAIMNLIGGSADRSKAAIETKMKGEDGRIYVFTFGEHLTPLDHEFVEEEVGNETHFTIVARTLKEAKTLLGRIKKKHPQFDIDEAMKHAVTEHHWPEGPLHLNMQMGPSILFPWTFSAAAVFATFHGQAVPPGFRTYVERFDLEAPTLPPDTFFFMPETRWIEAAGEVTHRLALVGDPKKGRLLFYAELFDAVGVGVTWPYAGDQPICETYAVDVLAGKSIPATVDLSAIITMAWSATHKLGDSELYARTTDRIGHLMQTSIERQLDREVEDALTRAWGPADGRRLRPEDFVRFLEELATLTEHIWTNPAVTPDIREQMIERFSGICDEIAKKIPVPFRAAFSQLLKPLEGRLVRVHHAATTREGSGGF